MDASNTLEIDDFDLEMLEHDPQILKTITATGITTATGAPSSRTKNKRIAAADDDDGRGGGDVKKSKTNANPSEVWDYFTKLGIRNGVEKCECKSCKQLYTCKSNSGTTHLRRHVEKCFKTPRFHSVTALLDNHASLLKKWKFDQKAYREGLARAVIKHDLPFNFAEYDGINELNKNLNPDFKSVCRNTLTSDVKNVHLIEKAKLKSALAKISGRICLTSDAWTAVTTQGYMTVTAHYVDENWKLNSKLLAFCDLESPHTANELSGQLLRVLDDWGISSKIFSITLDNASSNDAMQRVVRDRLNTKKALLCKGEFFHVRCCAHILNLVVQDGLKGASKSVEKIKESVKYVKSSEGRLKLFRQCIEQGNLGGVGGGFLRLDVSTRWNSTYLMLESAIKYRSAFSIMSLQDKNFKCCPTDEEWDRGVKMRVFLAPFYNLTNLMSGSSYPTSNLYFKEIATIEMRLTENMCSEDEALKEICRRMKVKFDKYWDEYCLVLAFGSVLDPTKKLCFLNFCYKKLYPETYQEKVNMINEAMHKLFSEYEQSPVVSSSSRDSSMSSSFSRSMSVEDSDEYFYEEYSQEMSQFTSTEGKSELDIYLEEKPILGKNIDMLHYWKMNKDRFPQLANMACDVLSIPITTVASESSFSIGGRILNKYRSCLLSENLQALICTRSWLHGFKEVVSSDAKEFVEIPLFMEDLYDNNGD